MLQHIDQVKVDKVSEDLSEKVNNDSKVIQNSGEHSLNVGEGLVNGSLSRCKILSADLRRSFLFYKKKLCLRIRYLLRIP